MLDQQATIKIRYEGLGPLTVGHLAWYPGETWNVDPATLARLQADGVAVCLIAPAVTTTGEPVPTPEVVEPEVQAVKRGRKATTL